MGRMKHGSDGVDEHPGLRALVQRRLLDDVFQKASTTAPGWKILVVDEASMKVISSAVGMYDIMEKRISLVEALEKKRAPFPDKGVLYMMEPTEESVALLLEDYNPSIHKKSLYGKDVFLYFLGRLSDSLLNDIKQCRPLVKRIKGLSEINVNFLPQEDRAFTLDLRHDFASFYLKQNEEFTSNEVVVAEKLMTVCATLNEYPHIRFRASSGVCTSLAKLFHKKMDDFVASNPSWWYYGGGQSTQASSRDRATLLLLDRADDCLSPLMHDFTYQPMVRDLIPMEGDKMTYENKTSEGEKEDKDVLLNEKDELWVELRSKHIAEVIQILQKRIKEIMSSKISNLHGGEKGNMSLEDLAAAVKAAPEYQEIMSKLSQHMHISDKCMTTFTRDNLMELSEMEQTLATGENDEGQKPQLDDIVDQAERFLKIMTSAEARLRLILIVTISQGGLSSQDRRRLLNAAELERDEVETMNNLEQMGISIFAASTPKKITSMFAGLQISSVQDEEDDESEFQSSRFNPVMKHLLLSMLIDQNLSFELYPSVLPMPDASASTGAAASARRTRDRKRPDQSARKKRSGPSDKWSGTSGGGSQLTSSGVVQYNFTGPRTIVFMVGGISYSELRVCRDIMEKHNREIIVGSTAFINAQEFMEDIATLKRDTTT